MNLYGFGGGDPVNFSDPFGLCPEDMGGDGKTKGNKDCPRDSKGWNQYRSGAAEAGGWADPLFFFGGMEVKEAEAGAEATIGTYKAVRAAIKGSGLQAHHLIEKRFAGLLGEKCGFRSIPITRFARSRSLISLQADHSFRSKPITRFAPSRSPVSAEADQRMS